MSTVNVIIFCPVGVEISCSGPKFWTKGILLCCSSWGLPFNSKEGRLLTYLNPECKDRCWMLYSLRKMCDFQLYKSNWLDNRCAEKPCLPETQQHLSHFLTFNSKYIFCLHRWTVKGLNSKYMQRENTSTPSKILVNKLHKEQSWLISPQGASGWINQKSQPV